MFFIARRNRESYSSFIIDLRGVTFIGNEGITIFSSESLLLGQDWPFVKVVLFSLPFTNQLIR